jgi:hypothetical protein
MPSATATPRGSGTITTASRSSRAEHLQARRDRPHHDQVAVGAGDRARDDRARGRPHHRQFTLTSTQQSVTVPITEADIPNVFVSVLLVKGRTAAPAAGARREAATRRRHERPGQAPFRLGIRRAEGGRRRQAAGRVGAGRPRRVPAREDRTGRARGERTHEGRGAPGGGHAVGRGLRRAVAHRVPTPDVLASVYVRKALQVANADSRQRIISRRVLTPKGETDGGGGGADAGRRHAAQATSACSRSGSARS